MVHSAANFLVFLCREMVWVTKMIAIKIVFSSQSSCLLVLRFTMSVIELANQCAGRALNSNVNKLQTQLIAFAQ